MAHALQAAAAIVCNPLVQLREAIRLLVYMIYIHNISSISMHLSGSSPHGIEAIETGTHLEQNQRYQMPEPHKEVKI